MLPIPSALGYVALLAYAWLTGRRHKGPFPWKTTAIISVLFGPSRRLPRPAVRGSLSGLVSRLMQLLQATAPSADRSLFRHAVANKRCGRDCGGIYLGHHEDWMHHRLLPAPSGELPRRNLDMRSNRGIGWDASRV